MEHNVEGRRDIEHALDRLLRQPQFVASPRLQAFLRFVVEETLEGRASRLKAFTIATGVFGRGQSFDPQTNPVVRVEALRLRRMLDQYYAQAGAADRIAIRLRRGSYVPEFVRAHEPESLPPAASDDPADKTAPLGDPPPAWRTFARRPAVWAAAAAVAALSLSLAIGWDGVREAAPAATGEAPAAKDGLVTIAVGPIDATPPNPALGDVARRLTRQIEDTLSLYDNPVVLQTQAGAPASDYQLSGVIAATSETTLTASFRILHVPSRQIIWSQQFDGLPLAGLHTAKASPVRDLAAAIARTYGIVYSDMRARLGATLAAGTGFSCVMLADAASAAPSEARFAAAKGCLDQSLADDPTFAPGYTARAFLTTAQWLNGFADGPSEEALDGAIDAARRAVALAPHKGRPHTARFWARFFSAHYEDAFDSAQMAVRLNPYSNDTRVRLGAAYLLRGKRDEAHDLLQDADQFSIPAPGWQEFFFFLDAYLAGDQQLAARHAMRATMMDTPLGYIARIITANRTGDRLHAKRWRREMSLAFPRFAGDIRQALDRWSMVPVIRDRLLADMNADTLAEPASTGPHASATESP